MIQPTPFATPWDQRLELRFSRYTIGERSKFTNLLRDKRTVTVFGHTVKYASANGTGYGVY